MNLISPSPHEMDVSYFNSFISELNTLRPGFQFHVNAFHHYSAYNADDLADINFLAKNPKPMDFIASNVLNSSKEYLYDLPTLNSGKIKTVKLESNPSNQSGFWICPELDGYFQRGKAVYDEIKAGYDAIPEIENSDPQIWITEWGYPASTSRSAKYPPNLPSDGEVQARWMMRGYLEYDRSEYIQASYWHWFQDSQGGGPEWDNTTGVLSPAGTRRAAWYYLQTMINEIGDLSFYENITLPACVEDYIPTIEVQTKDEEGNLLSSPIFIAEDPIESCPRIYKYANDCCAIPTGDGGTTDVEDIFLETVWVIWFPHMIDKKETMLINIADLGVNGTPQQYYTVMPMDGTLNGVQSPITDIVPNQAGDKLIMIEVTEKPIFLHFLGECPCSNFNPGDNPNGCEAIVDISLVDAGCTSITYNIELSVNGACLDPEILSVNAFNSVQGANSGYEVDNAGTGVAQITFTGLSPGVQYDFNISVGYQVTTTPLFTPDFGTSNNNMLSATTVFENCFDDIGITTVHEINDACNQASLEFNITADEQTDVSPLTIATTFTQVESDCQSNQFTSPMPLPNIMSIDWQNQGVDNGDISFLSGLNLTNLTPGGCYCITIDVIDNNGFSYFSEQYNFCADEVNCSSNLPPVNILKSDCESTCFNITSFTDDDGIVNCVTGYRLEIYDSSGNKVERYLDGLNPCDQNEFCFEDDIYQELLGGLMDGPYIGNVVTIYDLPNSNGSVTTSSDFFPVEAECCLEDFSIDPEISFTCNLSAFAYIKFCLPEEIGCDLEDVIILANGSRITKIWNWQSSSSLESPNCFIAQIRVPKPTNCQNVEYEIIIRGFNDREDLVFSGIIPYEGCCPGIPDPDLPNEIAEFRELRIDNIVNIDDQIVVDASLSNQLNEIANESREQGIIPRFVFDEDAGDILGSDKYYDNILLNFASMTLDYEQINNEYNIHLLANNKVYEVHFPESDVNERSESSTLVDKQGVLIYPNPSSGVIFITSNENISEVEIFTVEGKLVLQNTYDNEVSDISNIKLDKGVFLVKVKLVNGESIVNKVIILN